MRLLALVSPRLGIQLARRADPTLSGRTIALLAGDGEAALVAVPSVEATAGGIETGMTIAQARERVPALVALPDNAGECLDVLEDLASILRTNATPNVAIVSRDTILLSLEGLESRFDGESGAANALVRFARMWSGLDIRAGVAGSVDGAIHAARSARRFPVICSDTKDAEPLPRMAYELGARANLGGPQSAAAVETRLARALATLETALEAVPASYREVRFELTTNGRVNRWTLRAAQPVHTAAEAFDIVRTRIPADALEGGSAFAITLRKPGPDTRVNPWRRPVATMHTLAGPAVPVQHRLRLRLAS